MRVSPRWTVERYSRFYADDYRDLYSPRSFGQTVIDHTIALSKGPGARHVAAFVEKTWLDFGNNKAPVIMELGAGGGWNLACLPKDWVRVGFDTDERYLEAGRVAFNITMQNGFVDDVLPELHRADIVLLSHVLEHLSDPLEMIRRIVDATRPEVLIVVEVPGIFRLHKSGLDLMRYWQNAHTFTFTARTLADTCRRAGFEPLRIDEHIQMVFSPSNTIKRPLIDDPELADDILEYMKACEWWAGTIQYFTKIPLLNRAKVKLDLIGDVCLRVALKLGLLKGPGRHLVKEK
jgi:SAM-dependent methyltransferase